jgi:hypothetical protein
MKQHASGSFEVKLQPQSSRQADGNTLARMSLDKVFSGDLQGEGKGEMLAARTAVEGSAAYVAVESFSGSVHGKAGSFVFAHRGWMERGVQSLLISVVPDSGTGALAGIIGTLGIRIEDGVHYYDFDYTLPDA